MGSISVTVLGFPCFSRSVVVQASLARPSRLPVRAPLAGGQGRIPDRLFSLVEIEALPGALAVGLLELGELERLRLLLDRLLEVSGLGIGGRERVDVAG